MTEIKPIFTYEIVKAAPKCPAPWEARIFKNSRLFWGGYFDDKENAETHAINYCKTNNAKFERNTAC